MDLITASNIVFKYFLEDNEGYLVMPDDLMKLQLVTPTPELDVMAYKEVLKEFAATELVKSIPFTEKQGNKTIDKVLYVLIKPFSQIDRNFAISSELAGVLASTINSYLSSDDTKNVCDARNLKESDLENLLIILQNQQAEIKQLKSTIK